MGQKFNAVFALTCFANYYCIFMHAHALHTYTHTLA